MVGQTSYKFTQIDYFYEKFCFRLVFFREDLMIYRKNIDLEEPVFFKLCEYIKDAR